MIFDQLTLQSRNLMQLKIFYSEVLGCPLKNSASKEFQLQIGTTTLTFEEQALATPYHFAINIPANKIEEAADWLRQRVEILPGKDGEIVDFSSWKAKSVYFYDSDKNIVELIARERIGKQTQNTFEANQFLSISEIGIPVENILHTYDQLSAIAPFPVFSGSFDTFCAIGNDEGLFIVIDKNKKDWFPTHDPAPSSGFKISGTQQPHAFQFYFKDGTVKAF